MRRGHVSESHTGRHPNSRGVKVTQSGSSVEAGEHIKRTHESHRGVQVMDSPSYVAPPKILCPAVRTDGKACMNEVRVEGELCFGHRAGRGAIG